MVTLVLWLRHVVLSESHPGFCGYWASILIIELFLCDFTSTVSMEPYQGGLAHE
jgi:hypothetical protein